MLSSMIEGGSSYSLFKVEGDHLHPRPAAAAYASVARFLAGVEDPRRVPLHQDLWAYVFRHGQGTRAALWTPREDRVSLRLALPPSAVVFDLMGNEVEVGLHPSLRTTLFLTQSPLFVVDEATPAADFATRLAEASFHLPCAKLALTFPDLHTAQFTSPASFQPQCAAR